MFDVGIGRSKTKWWATRLLKRTPDRKSFELEGMESGEMRVVGARVAGVSCREQMLKRTSHLMFSGLRRR